MEVWERFLLVGDNTIAIRFKLFKYNMIINMLLNIYILRGEYVINKLIILS